MTGLLGGPVARVVVRDVLIPLIAVLSVLSLRILHPETPWSVVHVWELVLAVAVFAVLRAKWRTAQNHGLLGVSA